MKLKAFESQQRTQTLEEQLKRKADRLRHLNTELVGLGQLKVI